ncbi:hypothetical protein EJB05_26236, partial [Eragrostis curvula]
MKTIAKRRNIHQAQVSTPLSCADEGTRNQGNVVLNPIAARRVGRPPLPRKESEADGKVRKMRGKKQGASTRLPVSQKGRGNKAKEKSLNKKVVTAEHGLVNMTDDGQYTSMQYSQQPEPSVNQPTSSFPISSHVDILQGNADVMQLFSSNMDI